MVSSFGDGDSGEDEIHITHKISVQHNTRGVKVTHLLVGGDFRTRVYFARFTKIKDYTQSSEKGRNRSSTYAVAVSSWKLNPKIFRLHLPGV